MKMHSIKKRQPGFTILELLMAIVMLGVMLTLATSVVIATIRFYAFANTVRQNQESGRNIMFEIGRVVQYGRYDASGSSSEKLCIYKPAEGVDVIYTIERYKIVKYVDRNIGTKCDTKIGNNVVKVDITPANMKVKSFEVTKVVGSKPSTNPNAAALIIKITFLTGQTTESGGQIECVANSIYCNKLDYTTAISADNQGASL